MGTTDNFNEDSPAKVTFVAADALPIIDSVTTRAAYVTGGIMLAGLAGVVNTTATTLAITQATHGNKTITVSTAAPIAITLPQATGTGTTYRFVFQVAATATSSTIAVANATDSLTGVYMSPCTATATHMAFAAVTSATTASRSDTVTFNGTTTGGAQGMVVEIRDIQTGFFSFMALDTCVSTTTTPFSAAV